MTLDIFLTIIKKGDKGEILNKEKISDTLYILN